MSSMRRWYRLIVIPFSPFPLALFFHSSTSVFFFVSHFLLRTDHPHELTNARKKRPCCVQCDCLWRILCHVQNGFSIPQEPAEYCNFFFFFRGEVGIVIISWGRRGKSLCIIVPSKSSKAFGHIKAMATTSPTGVCVCVGGEGGYVKNHSGAFSECILSSMACLTATPSSDFLMVSLLNVHFFCLIHSSLFHRTLSFCVKPFALTIFLLPPLSKPHLIIVPSPLLVVRKTFLTQINPNTPHTKKPQLRHSPPSITTTF